MITVCVFLSFNSYKILLIRRFVQITKFEKNLITFFFNKIETILHYES